MDLKQKLLSQSTVIFAARIFGAGLIFLAQAAIARFWGANILGEYLLILAAVNLIAVAMPLGFETIGSYFAAEYRAKGEGKMLWGFIVGAYQLDERVRAAIGYPGQGPSDVSFEDETGYITEGLLEPVLERGARAAGA